MGQTLCIAEDFEISKFKFARNFDLRLQLEI